MAISKAMESAMEDAEFTASLDAMQTKEEVVAAFAAKGIDVEQEMGLAQTESELSEDELDESALDSVSGGGTDITPYLKEIIQTLGPTGIKKGWNAILSYGVIMLAWADSLNGNVYAHYNERTIIRAFKNLGMGWMLDDWMVNAG